MRGRSSRSRSSAPTTSTRRSATACRRHSTSGLPIATIDEACAAGTLLVLAPDLKEELPVLYLRVRDAVEKHRLRVIELSPVATSLTPLAAASLRYRPGEQAALVESLLGKGPRARGRQPRLALVLHRRRRHRRPTVGCRGGRPRPRRRSTRSSRPDPMPGSSLRRGGATCAARSTWVSRRACFPDESRSTTVARGSPSSGARCRPLRVSTPQRSCAAAADGRIGVPRAARRRPALRLPRSSPRRAGARPARPG